MSEKKKKRGLTDREPIGLLGRIAAALSPGSKPAEPADDGEIAPPMLEPDAKKDEFADWDDEDGEVTIVSFSDFD